MPTALLLAAALSSAIVSASPAAPGESFAPTQAAPAAPEAIEESEPKDGDGGAILAATIAPALGAGVGVFGGLAAGAVVALFSGGSLALPALLVLPALGAGSGAALGALVVGEPIGALFSGALAGGATLVAVVGAAAAIYIGLVGGFLVGGAVDSALKGYTGIINDGMIFGALAGSALGVGAGLAAIVVLPAGGAAAGGALGGLVSSGLE